MYLWIVWIDTALPVYSILFAFVDSLLVWTHLYPGRMVADNIWSYYPEWVCLSIASHTTLFCVSMGASHTTLFWTSIIASRTALFCLSIFTYSIITLHYPAWVLLLNILHYRVWLCGAIIWQLHYFVNWSELYSIRCYPVCLLKLNPLPGDDEHLGLDWW